MPRRDLKLNQDEVRVKYQGAKAPEESADDSIIDAAEKILEAVGRHLGEAITLTPDRPDALAGRRHIGQYVAVIEDENRYATCIRANSGNRRARVVYHIDIHKGEGLPESQTRHWALWIEDRKHDIGYVPTRHMPDMPEVERAAKLLSAAIREQFTD